MTAEGWEAASLRHGGPPPPLRAASPELRAAERAAWRALRALRCEPWFGEYAALRRARFGELQPTAFDLATPPAYVTKGMVLSEHAGGRYVKEWRWAWTWLGPRKHRVGT